MKISITGYEGECNCEHCGRNLKHGIRLSDGRVVGSTCLDKAITAPKIYRGKKYRLGSELIIKAAKCAQFVPPDMWSRYGVCSDTLIFDLA